MMLTMGQPVSMLENESTYADQNSAACLSTKFVNLHKMLLNIGPDSDNPESRTRKAIKRRADHCLSLYKQQFRKLAPHGNGLRRIGLS